MLTPRIPAGVTAPDVAGDADLRAAVLVQHHAYGITDPPDAGRRTLSLLSAHREMLAAHLAAREVGAANREALAFVSP